MAQAEMAGDRKTGDCPCTQAQVLEHWQGHRRLTRKVIEAFPEDQMFTFTLGGMRTFGAMVHEFLGMALPVANQVATGTWGDPIAEKPTDKAGLLRLWDEHTAKIDAIVPAIAPERFHEKIKIYEQYEVTGMEAIQYTVDNEIHHRGQGYVYLRALGFEPPAFYDRS
ncbi:DinB family protein [Terriglobus aquaticus]|uniref:DinB family protein n=1 Tax=Terriglobus aquaticus TaxID=940139 RepID=A0ABW9KRK0_9BACT|nr:DinB family protein [Terriglobus aquaticus]